MHPELSLSGRSTNTLKEGDRLQLNCTSKGSYPRASIVWLFDGRTLIVESSRIGIVTMTTQDDKTDYYTETSTVTVENMLASDSGRYTCRADFFPGEPSPTLTTDVTVQGVHSAMYL